MYLNGKVEVLITSIVDKVKTGTPKRLETVSEIEITNDVSQLGANCDITVPLNVRIENKGQYLIDNVRNIFKSGDFVEIYAWYEEYKDTPGKQKIFEGFILDYLEGTPLKIRCLDYVYKLRQGNVYHIKNGKKINGLNYSKARIKDVIGDILKDTGIELMKPYADFEVVNMSFVNQSPAAALEMIKSDLGFIVCSIIGQKLYFNIAKNTIGHLKLQSDVNIIGCRMQKPDAAYKKFKVQVWMKNANGKKELVEVGDADGEIRQTKLFNLVVNKNEAIIHGENALENVKLGHYNGVIETLLYPESNLFDAVEYTDVRYPERTGIYTVRSLTITLNDSGFRRELTVAYLNEKT